MRDRRKDWHSIYAVLKRSYKDCNAHCTGRGDRRANHTADSIENIDSGVVFSCFPTDASNTIQQEVKLNCYSFFVFLKWV